MWEIVKKFFVDKVFFGLDVSIVDFFMLILECFVLMGIVYVFVLVV